MNSIYFANGTLNVIGDGVVDMLDPMRRSGTTTAVNINLTGGTWYLAGINDFAASGANNTKFSITGGGLYLYGAGEASKSGAKGADDAVVTAMLGTVNLGGANSSFTLGSDAILTAGGNGTAITATTGSIALANNATLGFNLANYDTSSSNSMLTLTASTLTVGNNLNINLTSMANAQGDYNLLSVSNDGVLDAGKITLMAAGQVIDDVDFLQNARGNVVGNDYIVTIGGYTWDSSLIRFSDHKNLAHGDFTVASGEFTIAAAFDNRTDITSATNAYGWDGTTLTKKGAGKLILDGVNTYTGLTTVEAGSLIVGGTSKDSTAQIAGDVSVFDGAYLWRSWHCVW